MLALFCGHADAQAPVVVPGTTAVGQSAAAVNVTVTMSAAGTGATTSALTLGIAGKDFSASATPCTGTYSVGSQCTVSVTFAPKYPGVRRGAVVVTNSGGQLLGSALVTGNATGSLSVLTPGDIHTVAGDGELLYRQDNVPATTTPIYLPQGVVADASGAFYIADTNNNRIRKVDTSGTITTVAGTGLAGYAGDGGPATAAQISLPSGITLDGAGNIYFADDGNNIIRRVDANTGIITTIVGVPMKQGYTGDGGAGTAAYLSSPRGIAFDATGNLYIADTGNNVVRKVNASTGIITTVAGNGTAGYSGDGAAATAAMLNTPWSMAFGPDGSLYIADLDNNMVRRVSTGGTISTVAGNGNRGFTGDGGPATAAALNDPAAVVVNPAGDLYIGDSGNNRVRRVDTTGKINTIIGTGAEAYGGDDGPAPNAAIYAPYALHYDQAGNLYLSDMLHNRIRWVPATPIALQYPDMRVGKLSAPQAVGVENDGNSGLNLSTPVFVNAALDSGSTTCSFTAAMASDGTCNLGVEFAPTTTGSNVQGTLTMPSNAGNAPSVVNLSGQVLSVEPVTVTLTSSPNPSLVNQNVVFTATVSSADPNVSGPVTFLDGTTPICSNIAISGGVAVCNTSTLTLGSHSVTANYGGDANNEAKVSAPDIQVVQQSSNVTLTVAPNPAVVTANVTLTATVTAPSGTPTGSVVFYDGVVALTGNIPLTSGVATFSTTALTPGTHTLAAKYSGDASNAAGTSNPVNEVINQATTTTTLASSNPNAYVGGVVTFTATVTSANGTIPTGTVQFSEGASVLGTQSLNTSGTATFSTATLAPGNHNIVATYAGDTNDSGSSSTALLETIQQIPTVTTLSSTSATPTAGQTVTFTATVAINGSVAADGPISGTVTFTNGPLTLGTSAVDASGQATISTTMQAGTQNFVATYNGSTNYATSTSSTLVETVSNTPTTTALTSSPTSSLSGKSATFTATVSSSTGVPTGSVTFTDGATNLGTIPLNQGVATLTTSNLSVASHSIVATYNGDSNYVKSQSTPVVEVVSLAITTTTLAGPSMVDVGATVILTGGVTSTGVAPTGTLTLLDGGTAIGTQNVGTSGSFTFSTSTLSIGTHNLSVTYAGDANNGGSTSPTVTVVVQQAPTTTSLASSANPSTLGQPLTLTASVTSTGAGITGSVSFMDGSTLLGSVALTNGTATLTTSGLTFGNHTLTAVYSGDTNHSVSTSATLTEHIVQAAVATLSSSLNPATSGSTVIFTAKLAPVGSLVPSGSVTFRDGGNALATVPLDATGSATFQTSTLGVGSHNISVTYGGDTNFAASSAMLTQLIQSANTQIVLTASSNPATYGSPLNLVATITSNGGIATGSVVFTDGGTTVGSAVLNASGVATLTTSTLSPGTHSIVANYAGDGKASSSVSTPLTVTVLQTTTTTLASNANPALTLSPVLLTATVKSPVTVGTGAVTFTDGSTLLGTAQLDASGVATLTVASLSSGSHSLTASYAGDGKDYPSNGTLTQIVQLRPTTTTMSSSQTNPANPQQVTLIGVAHYTGPQSPTGTITFSTGGTTIGSSPVDATGVASLTVVLQVTSEQVVATYNGDTAYAGSASDPTTVTAGQATQFTLTLTPPNVTVQSSQHVSLTLTASSIKGFGDTLEFGCLGQPYASTCTFSKTQDTLDPNGTDTVTLTIDTGNPLGGGAAASSSMGGSGRMLLISLPLTLLMGFLLLRKGNKQRKLPALLMALFTLALAVGATGCAGLSSASTPAGTYTFLVTASGKGSGATQSQTIVMTVTK